MRRSLQKDRQRTLEAASTLRPPGQTATHRVHGKLIPLPDRKPKHGGHLTAHDGPVLPHARIHYGRRGSVANPFAFLLGSGTNSTSSPCVQLRRLGDSMYYPMP